MQTGPRGLFSLRCPECGAILRCKTKALENGVPVRTYKRCACGILVITKEHIWAPKQHDGIYPPVY